MVINQDPIYIMLHIHKCAGTTLTRHIADHLNPQEYISLYKMQHPLFENRSIVRAYLCTLSSKRLNMVKIIMGHGAYYGIHTYISQPCRYIVFLRDPHARIVSNYAFFLENRIKGVHKRNSLVDTSGKPYSFNAWLSKTTRMHDYMTRFLYHSFFYRRITGEVSDDDLARVVQILKTFYLVGLVERPQDHWYLYDSIGVPLYSPIHHATDRQFFPSSASREYTKQYLVQDMKLYSYFQLHAHPQIGGISRLSYSFRAFLDKMKRFQ